MAFSLSIFLIDLAEIGPAIVSGVLSLKNETGTVSKTQLASDSLKLATGITTALTSSDPTEQNEANAASTIAESVVLAVAQSTKQNVT